MADIVYYKNYRLIKDRLGYWYSEQFKEYFNTLSLIKKHVDKQD